LPSTATLALGATATLTLTLDAAPATDTAVALASHPAGFLSLPTSVTVPAGSVAAPVPVVGAIPGVATLTAGPLNGTTAQGTLTVAQLPPALTEITPATLSLPKGRVGVLTLTLAPIQPEAVVVALTSTDPARVEVPLRVTVPAGASTALIPVLTRDVGTATITAGPLNDTMQQASVTVTPAELLLLTLSPPGLAAPLGKSEPFTATGIYTDGSTRDLTGTAAWTSSDESVASVTAGGLATGHKQGDVTITATEGGITGTASLTITAPVLGSLAVSPADPTQLVGQSVQVTATGTLTDGTTQDLTATVTWTSSDQAVATITSPGGLATALAPGVSTITATSTEGLAGSTHLTVSLPLPPTITGFTPLAGPVGALVTLTGSNLDTATQVAFNGRMAAFTVLSSAQLTATVPAGASTGPISVGALGGTASTAAPFSVLPPLTLTVAAPQDGATLNADQVLVSGTVGGADDPTVGVMVDGTPTPVVGGRWTAAVPLRAGVNPLSVTAADVYGRQAAVTVTVTVPAADPAPLVLRAMPASGSAPLTVTWEVGNDTGHSLVEFAFDPSGQGSFGPPTATFRETPTPYLTPGVFLPTLRATDEEGTSYQVTTVVQVLDPAALDGYLQRQWASLKAALMAGDPAATLPYFATAVRDRYAALFQQAASALPRLGADMPPIQLVYLTDTVAKYRLRRLQAVGGSLEWITHYLYFSVDEDGLWRLESF
jgi:hypothetical protein